MSNFKLGKLVATAAVVDMMQKDHVFAAFVSKSIRRYEECDWGDTCEEDKKTNYKALEDGGINILATYEQAGVKTPMKILITTEWDRSATTILFPEEYRGGDEDV